jgi:hypothetical protein
MKKSKTKRKPKWWNNGWVGLVLLLITYFTLFYIGKFSATYEPNPVIEGRLLSDWTDDLGSPGWQEAAHRRAVVVLREHREEVTPILIEWLDERDTIPQLIYYSSMSIREGKGKDLLDYRGSYYNQIQAAMAFQYMEGNGDEVNEALRRVIDQYGEGRHYAAELAQEALNK